MAVRQQHLPAVTLHDQIWHRQDPPPPYERYSEPTRTASQAPLVAAMYTSDEKSISGWNPKGWGLKKWLILAAMVIVVIVAVVVGVVLGLRANAYPDYSKLTYSLKDTYEGTSFFDNFDYFTGYDPSSGFVHYVDSATAASMNLTYASESKAVLRVDTSENDASTGRKSVRITSKNQYNTGLFVFDVVRSPYGCGTWPALWLTDPSNWPIHGEIDVMEAVNTADDGNQMTLHTSKNCKMNRKRKETGSVLTKDCYNGTDSNAGCGVQGSTKTYGEDFNTNGGGVYATELRAAGIRVWFFPRSSIPSDITNGSSPDPSSWGTALADFPSTGCDITSHFKNQSIIANIDLCGSWAGQASIFGESCSGTCTEWVAGAGSRFSDAVWEFNSFKVYQAA